MIPVAVWYFQSEQGKANYNLNPKGLARECDRNSHSLVIQVSLIVGFTLPGARFLLLSGIFSQNRGKANLERECDGQRS